MRSETYKHLIAIILIFFISDTICLAKEISVAVIYPHSKNPVNRIYKNIIKGIEQILPQIEVLTIDTKNPSTHLELETTLQKIKPRQIIALG